MGGTHGRPSKRSAGAEQSVNRSPLHPHYSGRAMAKDNGVSSPSREEKNLHESSHGTPGRSHLNPVVRCNDSLNKGAAVPKFGDWDESDPASADGYTHIFNIVREERHTGGANVPRIAHEPSYYDNIRKPKTDGGDKCCCFPWGRK